MLAYLYESIRAVRFSDIVKISVQHVKYETERLATMPNSLHKYEWDLTWVFQPFLEFPCPSLERLILQLVP